MTSMTTVGGLIPTAPQWRLGEMGQLIQEHMDHKIDSLDALNLYMQRNDADLLYGGRILAQIDAILADVRRHGISKDLAVAVESSRPGTIPKNVQKILTSNYTGTHQRETIAALESWKEAGRMGLIILVLTAILKMVSWLVSNGKGFKGNTNAKSSAEKVEEFKTKTDEKFEAAAEAPPAAEKKTTVNPDEWKKEYDVVSNGLTTASLKDAYLRCAGEMKSNKGGLTRLAGAAMYYQVLINQADGSDYIDTVTAISGRNPMYAVLKLVADGESNGRDFSLLIQELMRMNVTDAVFTPQASEQAFNRLPKGMKEAGVRVPNEAVFRVMSNRLPELQGYFVQSSKAYGELSRLIRSGADEGKWDKDEIRVPGTNFAHALRFLNDYLATVIPAVKMTKRHSDETPTVAVDENESRKLIGYDEPTEFLGGKVLVGAQYGAYLNGNFVSQYAQDATLTDDDAVAVLSSLVVLAKGITSNTNVTNLSGYNKLEAAVKDLIKVMENFDKDMKRSREGAKIMDTVGRSIHELMMEDRTDSLNAGREISASYDDQRDGDFWSGMRTNINYIRRICMGVVGMQNIINKSDRNPFVKGKD